jgi:hypothetical protein
MLNRRRKIMLDPIKYPQYYVEKPDQLSEKFKDQLEVYHGDVIFVVGIIIVCILAFIVG